MKQRRYSEHIRINPEDKKVWDEYRKVLGESSPALFSKIIRSNKLKLHERILNELKKKQEEFSKRI